MVANQEPSPPAGPIATDNEAAAPSFFLSRWLFLRLLGIVHLIAFCSLWVQIHGLIGSHGILPAARFLSRAKDQLADPYWRLPTLCWFNASDAMLNGLCATGVVAALLLIAGMAPMVSLFVLWVTYLSLSVVGQAFLGFQWDTLLLETTFFAMLFAPPSLWPQRARERRPSPWTRYLMWWLLFKLMFLSGATKVLSGDETWRNLTAMNFHYHTQPIPNGLSWFMDHLPEWWHHSEVIAMLVVELIVPLLIVGPRTVRHIACLLIILLQVGIEATGNYGFFSLLTITLCIPLLDDRLLRKFVPKRWRAGWGAASEPSPRKGWLSVALCLPAVGLWFVSFSAFLDEMVTTRRPATVPPVVDSVLDGCDRYLLSWSREPIESWLGPLRTINGYGLFRVMTTERPEIVIEGSRDGITWKEYPFRWKPGDVSRAPTTVAPHQPRLDWQMWFAALNPRGNEYWLASLMRHLLDGTPEVERLLGENPFPREPPQFVRLIYYRYEFTDPEARSRTGNWWERTLVGPLTPPLSRRDFREEDQ